MIDGSKPLIEQSWHVNERRSKLLLPILATLHEYLLHRLNQLNAVSNSKYIIISCPLFPM